MLCTPTRITQTPPSHRPLLGASEKLEEELFLEAKGESHRAPSDEPDLDSASEPEGPLAITSRAESVTRPSSQPGKWQSQGPWQDPGAWCAVS